MFHIRNTCFKKLLTDHIPKHNVKNSRTLQTSRALDTAKGIRTSLYDFHVKHGGKLINYADYLLPVQYLKTSISVSHLHTRKSASLFDVSHMLQTTITGSDCISWMEHLCPVDLEGMADGASALTVFMNENGGILDDLIVTKVASDHLYIVTNAGRMEHDKQHMMKYAEKYKSQNKDVNLKFHNVEELSLVALQGPKAVDSLQPLCKSNLSELYFMSSKEMSVAGVDCRVTRCGYTGEDGFEISMPSEKAIEICDLIMKSSNVKLAGLGVRDSLRLEAGLCLYGSEIHETVTPIEAKLAWLISKRRRVDGDFIGAEVVLKQLREGVIKQRVGLIMKPGPSARRGALIVRPDSTQEIIGNITSGCPSPSLSGSVAMGYVLNEFAKPGTELPIIVHNRCNSSTVVKLPFVPTKYYVNKNK